MSRSARTPSSERSHQSSEEEEEEEEGAESNGNGELIGLGVSARTFTARTPGETLDPES